MRTRSSASKKLGEKLFLDSGTLTPVLKSLESKGYVVRSRSKEDERVPEVEIIEKGEGCKKSALHLTVWLFNVLFIYRLAILEGFSINLTMK